MASIASLNVKLTASIGGFAAGMATAGKTLNVVQTAYAKATDQAAAYDRMTRSMGELKLAGAETVTSLQTVLAVARSELRKFARNKDVRVAVEIGREYIDEAWIKARPILQKLADASRIKVAAAVVADKAGDVRGWLDRQRRQLTKPITVRMELARRAIEDQVAGVRGKLDGLKQYRAVRIVLAAVNATKMPIAAAMAALTPLKSLAGKGLKVALSATHVGVAFAVNKATALLGGLASYGKSIAGSLIGTFASVATGAAGMLAVGAGAAVTGITGLGVYAVKLAADAEQARVSFTTMLGSAEKAKQLQAEINSFAAATPFQTPELIGAAKSLLAFGVAQQQIVPTMRTLGDLAAGLNIPLGDLADIYGKARVQGRLMAEDINQLTGRGIPVIGEFAKQFGVAEGDVRGLVEQGKIGFPQLQQALVSLTGSGGKFQGLMAAQSHTVAGLWSTLQDTLTLSLTQIGTIITDKLDLRGVIGGITDSLSAMTTTAMPLIEGFFGSLNTGGSMAKTAGDLVLSASEMIATGLAYAIDYSRLLVVAFKSMQAGAALAIGGLLKAVDFLGGGLVKLLNLLPGVNIQWTETIGAMADGVLDEADKLSGEADAAWNSFSNADSAKKVGQFFDQVRANAAKAQQATADVGNAAQQTSLKIEQAAASQNAKVLEGLADVQKEVAQFGLSESQTKLADMTTLGATPEQLAKAKELLALKSQLEGLNQIDTGDPLTTFASKMEQLQKLYAQGKVTAEQFGAIRNTASKTLNDKLTESARSVTESVKTPLEKYQEEMARLNELLNRGLITKDTFDRAAAQAADTMNGPNQTAAPTAMRAGSAEAQRFAYDSSRGMTKLTKDDTGKAQLAEAKDSNRLLNQLVRNTRPVEDDADAVEI